MDRITYKTFSKYCRPVQSLLAGIFLVPLGRLIALPLINHTRLKPWHITLLALVISLVSAWMFYIGNFWPAVLLFQLSVILDFVDGYIARIKKNGSPGGVVFDGYSDILRVMVNLAALAAWYMHDPWVILLFMLFAGLHFAESFLDFQFVVVEKMYSKNPPSSLSQIDQIVLSVKNWFEQYHLKTIFIHYQERLFFVLVLGPILDRPAMGAMLGIVAVLFSMHFKLLLDMALLKSKFVHSSEEYLRG